MKSLSLLCILTVVVPNVVGYSHAVSHKRNWKHVKPELELAPRCDGNCKGGAHVWSTAWTYGWTKTYGGSQPTQTQPPQTQPPASTPTDSGNSNTGGGGGGGDVTEEQAKYLSLHNDLRSQHGAGTLQWNNTLQTAAQKWADGCVFEHSKGALGAFGENLSTGTDGMTIDTAVQMWIDEAGDYDPSNPQYSHFTQMVWKGTTQVGCAFADNCNGIFDSQYGPARLYVCEYSPQGNVIGQFQDNVQK